MDFIPKSLVPSHKKVTYANMVCDYRPSKPDPNRTRLTVGGDRLDYWGDSASPAASLLDTKLLLNSVISDAVRGARFMCIDIKDFFLQSILPEYEYMRIHERYFYPDIRQKYNIGSLINEDGYVYCRLKKACTALNRQRDWHMINSSQYWQNMVTNPIVYTQTFEHTILDAQNFVCASMILVSSIIPTTMLII